MSYLEFYKAYLVSLNKSPHTIKQYCIDIEQFISYIDKCNLSFENRIDSTVEHYIVFLSDTYRSVSSFNRKIASLKHFLFFLKSRNVIQEIPTELLIPKKLVEHNIETLQEEQMKKVINYWLNLYRRSDDEVYKWIALRNFCIVRIISELSLKPSEVVEMKWSHINDQGIRITNQKRSRRVKLSIAMLQWLYIYKKAAEDLLPANSEIDFIWLGIGNKQNEPITIKTIERLFQAISREVGFKVTATMLRYSTINNEITKKSDANLDELYNEFGYSRKSVLVDRVKRFTKNESNNIKEK